MASGQGGNRSSAKKKRGLQTEVRLKTEIHRRKKEIPAVEVPRQNQWM